MSKQFSKINEKVPSDLLRETTATIAKQLNESAVERLKWIVAYLGPQVALEVMQETLDIEAQGGMLIQDGSRRRTPGGIFFSLVKKGVNKNDRRKLFPYTPSNQDKLWPKRRNNSYSASSQGSHSQREHAIRTKYQPEMKELFKSEAFGMADNMSVKLVGRPGKVVEKDSFVMTVMQLSPELPSISKDLPLMPQSSMRLLVYITKKQWDIVAPDLERPENSLNINGILTYDENLRRMVLFTRAVTIKIGQPNATQMLKEESTSDKTQDHVVSGPVEFSESEDVASELLQTAEGNQDAPEAASSSEETPEAASSDEDAPEAVSSDEETPEAASSDEEVPEAASSDEDVPEAASSSEETPEAASSDEDAPEAANSSKETPEAVSSDEETREAASSSEETSDAADSDEDISTDVESDDNAPSKTLSLEEEFAEEEPQNVVQSDLKWE